MKECATLHTSHGLTQRPGHSPLASPLQAGRLDQPYVLCSKVSVSHYIRVYLRTTLRRRSSVRLPGVRVCVRAVRVLGGFLLAGFALVLSHACAQCVPSVPSLFSYLNFKPKCGNRQVCIWAIKACLKTQGSQTSTCVT